MPRLKSMPATSIMSASTKMATAMHHSAHSRTAGVTVFTSPSVVCLMNRPMCSIPFRMRHADIHVAVHGHRQCHESMMSANQSSSQSRMRMAVWMIWLPDSPAHSRRLQVSGSATSVQRPRHWRNVQHRLNVFDASHMAPAHRASTPLAGVGSTGEDVGYVEHVGYDEAVDVAKRVARGGPDATSAPLS